MPCSIAQCGTSVPSPVCVCAHACLDLHAGLRQWAWVQLFNRQRQGLLGVSAPGTCMQTLTQGAAQVATRLCAASKPALLARLSDARCVMRQRPRGMLPTSRLALRSKCDSWPMRSLKSCSGIGPSRRLLCKSRRWSCASCPNSSGIRPSSSLSFKSSCTCVGVGVCVRACVRASHARARARAHTHTHTHTSNHTHAEEWVDRYRETSIDRETRTDILVH